ncbi:hypothetical protein FQA39_LY07773 [Lamprigera yunnana]|nr:hypothetical protein FQA39_LY07773 [Lamprigera yunnana]
MKSLFVLCVLIGGVKNECEPNYGFDKGTKSYTFGTYVYNGTISDCECGDRNICVRKCCHLNYIYRDGHCVFDESAVFKVDVYDGVDLINDNFQYRYLPGKMTCQSVNATYYRLEPNDYPEDQFYLQADGTLWQPAKEKYMAENRYCLEYFEDIGMSAFGCFPTVEKLDRGLNTLGMAISMPFLLTTFIVYALLPERNLHGKSLMCYVITLFGAYFSLVIMQQHTHIVGPGCITLGTFCLFFFMVSFLWMNAMSIDIWWTFKGIRGFSGNKKEVEHKRFLLYSAYTWGVSVIFVVIVTIINVSVPKSAWYKPGLGDGQCWFTGGLPMLLYFYGPLAIVVISNVVLFTRTALRIKQMRKDTAILRRTENKVHSDENDRQRFYLYLKLFLAMGVNWSMEIVSWAVDWQFDEVHQAVWILTDLCNALYGVFIFFIFVFKRPIWNLLKKRNSFCVLNKSLRFQIDVFNGTSVIDRTLEYRYLSGQMICNGENPKFYRLEAKNYPDDQFFLQTDGRLWQPTVNQHIAQDRYCLDYFEDIGVSAVACFENANRIGKAINTIGMSVSMPFLLATFIIYALLPERNLHAKSLMCYVITLFCAYLFLIVIQRHTDVTGPGCVVLGTFCLFFFMVSFLWMNVMSVDIWWTFKGIRGLSGNKRKLERRRFLLYSVYTWGVPLLFVILVTTINSVAPANSWYKPGLDDGQCWFNAGLPTLLYFYGPLAFVVIFNVVLFTRTAWRIKVIQEDTAILRRSENRMTSDENDTQRFYLYLKLFLAMGINWSMEIISWAIDWRVEEVQPAVWILTDLCNALYGVFIFFIFVFKRPVWNLLKRRLVNLYGKKIDSICFQKVLLGNRQDTTGTDDTSLRYDGYHSHISLQQGHA